MRRIVYHAQFKKDMKLTVNRGRDIALLRNVIDLLANDKSASSPISRSSADKFQKLHRCSGMPYSGRLAARLSI